MESLRRRVLDQELCRLMKPEFTLTTISGDASLGPGQWTWYKRKIRERQRTRLAILRSLPIQKDSLKREQSLCPALTTRIHDTAPSKAVLGLSLSTSSLGGSLPENEGAFVVAGMGCTPCKVRTLEAAAVEELRQCSGADRRRMRPLPPTPGLVGARASILADHASFDTISLGSRTCLKELFALAGVANLDRIVPSLSRHLPGHGTSTSSSPYISRSYVRHSHHLATFTSLHLHEPTGRDRDEDLLGKRALYGIL
ncbi:hypothetical protein HETIRDRAFT_105690 [Heterobasidion irregulare TC 32-1]|uniref:Uncharacterized protein n=1 Tax=Heterobasidion irregulare (strain TC 32-1) TaxID=747525 RepID=W4JU74_HETIT|nr:uncharacterized protein HETIRDRAFT_105690 [Heterobasidion irregulare TC 32-1]ETW77108.1 hypothetical protein HETIRDRAFT_105690 [Heterobasidion irregulare TC 32-1]